MTIILTDFSVCFFLLGVNHPQGYTNTYCFSPAPPPLPPRRPLNRVSSREILIEKIGKFSIENDISMKLFNVFRYDLETVTVQDPPRRMPPAPYIVSCIRAPSPPVRQLKIRHRPASCVDLRKETFTGYLTINSIIF